MGIVFLVLGILGLFLPVLQGVLFIVIGLALLFPDNKYIQKVLQRAKDRYPRQAEQIAAFKARVKGWLRRRRENLKGLS